MVWDGTNSPNDLTAYSPTWTGSGSNPVIASHALSGDWCMDVNGMVDFRINLVFGSTNFGTGSYIFGLPVPAHADYNSTVRASIGGTSLWDNSATARFLRHTLLANSTSLVVSDDTNTFFAQTVPFTVAVNDQALILGRYQAA